MRPCLRYTSKSLAVFCILAIGFWVFAQVQNIARVDTSTELANLLQTAKQQELNIGSDQVATASTYAQIGQLYIQLADYRNALEYFEKASVVFKERLGGDSLELGNVYEQIGKAYFEIAIYDRALAFQQGALDIYLGQNLPNEEIAQLYLQLGRSAQNLPTHRREAANDYIQAIRLFDADLGAENTQSAAAYSELGSYYLAMGQADLALEALGYAQNIQEAKLGSGHIDTARTYSYLGWYYQKRGHNDQATVFYTKARPIFEQVLGNNHPETSRLYDRLGQLLAQTKQAAQAIDYFSKALSGFIARRESAYQALDNPGKLRYNQETRALLDRLFAATLRLQNSDPKANNALNQVFEGWINYKGSAFAVENSLALMRDTASGELGEQVNRYYFIRAELGRLYTINDRNVDTTQIQTLEAELRNLEIELAAQIHPLKDLASLRDLKRSDIQQALKPGEVWLDYVWLDERVMAMSLDAAGRVRIVQLGSPITLQEQIKTLSQLLHNPNSKNPPQTFAQLQPYLAEAYSRLVKPLGLSLSSANTLIVSPDGPLFLLPFELFWDGVGILLQRLAMRYIPSARDYVRIKQNPANQPLQPAAIFGRPLYDAAAPTSRKTGLLDGLVKTLISEGKRFVPLQYTFSEANKIADLLKVKPFVDDEANEINLLKVENPRVLHIASHGFVVTDPELPNPLMRVGIALAGAQKSLVPNSKSAYGILSGLRLANLKLSGTQLVVLSACDTGTGEAIAGEGIMGLSQAMLMAGAQRVVVSLWAVPDQQTADLMVAFYKGWLGGTDFAQALRQVKLELYRKGIPPQTWAAFVISGI